jgi:hypothetical protein
MRFELFESDGSRWQKEEFIHCSVLCGALWHRGAILLAEI